MPSGECHTNSLGCLPFISCCALCSHVEYVARSVFIVFTIVVDKENKNTKKRQNQSKRARGIPCKKCEKDVGGTGCIAAVGWSRDNEVLVFQLFPIYLGRMCRTLYSTIVFMARTTIGFVLLVWGIVIASGVALQCQQPAFKCTRLTTADGLSDNMVFCSLQDRDGFMWFGTRDGLNKYDGYKFTVYRNNPTDSTTLSDNAIFCLFEDAKGNVWIGTYSGGICRFDKNSNSFVRYYHVPKYAEKKDVGQVTSICDDADGSIWMTTSSLPFPQLYKLNPATGHCINYSQFPSDKYKLRGQYVSRVCRDSTGRIWIVSGSGVSYYDAQHDAFRSVATPPELYALNVPNFVATDKQYLWVAGSTDDVWCMRYAQREPSFQRFRPVARDQILDNAVLSVLSHRQNVIFVATSGNGLYALNISSQRYVHLPQEDYSVHSLPSKGIFQLYKDRQGNVWVCTDAGIGKFNAHTYYFQHYNSQTGIPYTKLRSLYWDSHGDFWVGTAGGGLYKRAGDTSSHYTAASPYAGSLLANTVNALYEDSKQRLWVGTNRGVALLNAAKGNYQRTALPLNGDGVWSIVETASGDLWFGTLRGGLNRVDAQNKVTYFLRDTHSDGGVGILSLVEGATPILWVGTTNGLYKMNTHTNTWQHYRYQVQDSTGLNSNDIWYIHQAKNGMLWLGTSGGGLNLFDPATGKATYVTEKDGLPSNIICAILEDEHDNLWVSTNKGLARFNTKTREVKTFGVGDGLYISEFHFKTCFKAADGSMYFGGTGGYVHFHPDSIVNNATAPSMAFTGLKVFDKELDIDSSLMGGNRIVLGHNSNFFTVEFAALDFTNPVKNQYKYKLEGLDEQWRTTDGSKPSASYTSVPPGEYVFYVQGSNSDGVWNTKGLQLVIVVQPAWWQTWLFKVSVLAFAVLLVALGLQWRYRSLKRRNEIEKRLVESQLQALRSQMNPHFVFNSLNSILHFITSNDQETAHTYLSKFSKLIRAILEQSRSEFISLAEEVYVLKLYLELEALRFDNRFHYSITVSDDIDVEEQQIPPMLLQPHVENAIKHGLIHTVSDGRIDIVIRREGESIVCSVIDNGIGRQRSQSLREKSLVRHISRGTGLTEERLSILNNLHSAQYGIQTHDLSDSTGAARGTRVDVRIAIAGADSTAVPE